MSVTLLDEGLFLFLTSTTGPLASVLSVNNVFEGWVPPNSQMPCLMYEVVSEVSDTTLDGPSGFVSSRYQFNYYGRDLSSNQPGSGRVSARKLQETVRLSFEGLTGVLPNGIQLWNVIKMGGLGHYNADDQTFQQVTDYKIIYRQPQPGDANLPVPYPAPIS
jgi:hypothetical protein